MTHEQRIADLETRLAAAERITSMFTRGVSDDGKIPYLMLDGRLGIFTTYWMKKPWGQGAAFSVGCGADRFAGYFEVDEDACPDNPSVAVFASVVGQSKFNQPHIAFLGAAANAKENHGLFLSFSNDKAVSIREEGFELRGYVQYFMGKIDGVIKKLWP